MIWVYSSKIVCKPEKTHIQAQPYTCTTTWVKDLPNEKRDFEFNLRGDKMHTKQALLVSEFDWLMIIEAKF